MDMKFRKLAGTIFIILVVCMILYLVLNVHRYEGFVDKIRCGVDLPPCTGERVRCMNGYCKYDIPPQLPALSDLPMTPPTKYPYQ